MRIPPPIHIDSGTLSILGQTREPKIGLQVMAARRGSREKQSLEIARLTRECFVCELRECVGSICVLEKIGMEFLEYHFDQSTQRYACLYRISQSNFLSTAP